MGRINSIFFGSTLVLIVGLALYKYPPNYRLILQYPAIQEVISALKYPLNTIFNEFPQDVKPLKGSSPKERLMSLDELKEYDGKDGSKGLYLAILGMVFDVQKGKQHYGPGGGYEFFAGIDGSRAYVTGDFSNDGLIDDISGLSMQDFLGLDEWVKFYSTEYTSVGKLIGRYYDEKGSPTQYNYEAQKWIADAQSQKQEEDLEKNYFPPCNSEWSPEAGSRVYCTNKSGGVKRDWIGVPRKLFTPGKNFQERCACIKNFGPPSHDPLRNPHNNKGDLDYPNLKEYPNCPPEKDSCHLPKD